MGSFVDDFNKLKKDISHLQNVGQLITPERLKIFEALSSQDSGDIRKLITQMRILNESTTDMSVLASISEVMKKLANALPVFDRILQMENTIISIDQNQEVYKTCIDNLNTHRSISSISDSIKHIADMEKQIKKVSKEMPEIIDANKNIDELRNILLQIQKEKEEIQKMYLEIQQNKDTITQETKTIEAKQHVVLAETQKISSLKVNVDFVDYLQKSSYAFDEKTNTINITIKEGKPGPRGKYKGDDGHPGKNGRDFQIGAFGNLVDRGRYASREMGFSFLALDDIPTKIYFRNSHHNNTWTDGQPFGVSNGGYSETENGIDIVDGINIVALTQHVIAQMEKQDGNNNNSSTT